MNIFTQSCGLVLMMLMMYFYLSKRRLKLFSESTYLIVFYTAFFCVLLDIMSVIAIMNIGKWNSTLIDAIAKLYLVSLTWVALFGLLYVVHSLYSKFDTLLIRTRYMLVLLLLILPDFGILIAPINYFYDPETGILYSYGPATIITYLIALTFIISTFVLTIVKASHLTSRKAYAIRAWMIIWIFAALIQYFNNKLLIVSFATVIGILILYLNFENPEFNLDHVTGMFNQNAYYLATTELYNHNMEFSVISIIFDIRFEGIIQEEGKDILMSQMAKYFFFLPGVEVFKITDQQVLLLFKNKENAANSVQILNDTFDSTLSKYGDIIYYTKFIYVPDSTVVTSGKELLNLIQYVRVNNIGLFRNRFYTVNNNDAFRMNSENSMEQELEDAMNSDRVVVYFQPIYSTVLGRFSSAEALVRIYDKEGNLIPPDSFIHLAENNGMILRLGEIVFEKVCEFIKYESPEQYGLDYIEVNLSIVQCIYKHLASNFIRIMKKYDINPRHINFEITESASLRGRDTLIKNMNTLINYGVKFSLDDFGTGQSNLNYIVDFPFSIIKFDKNMTNSYFDNKKAKYIMDTAMRMIKGLGLEIVSEGVESIEQFTALKDLDIGHIQGYYFSRPLLSDDFIKFIKENNA
ncbi:MAG: EAL domain-containing protein [Lachnospiraceae bacterium]|nr:EAL domain-containing protein [Lachnospiraceae bacterium]